MGPTGAGTATAEKRAAETKERHEGRHLAGQARRAGQGDARPEDRGTDGRRHQGHLDRDLRLGPAPLRGARAVHAPGRHPGSRADGHCRAGRRRGDARAARRPGRHPLQHLVRALLHVRPRAVQPVRDHAGALGGQGRGAARLHPAVRARARRPGRVPAGPAGATSDRSRSRTRDRTRIPVPLRRAAHRVAGRRVRRLPSRAAPSPSTGSDRSGRWPPASRCTRAPRGSSASTPWPSAAPWPPRHGVEALDPTEMDDVPVPDRPDRRARARRRHRGRRHGGPRVAARQARAGRRRSAAGRRLAAVHRQGRDRPAGGAARGPEVRPTRRHGLDQRCLRRRAGPVADDGDVRPRHADADGQANVTAGSTTSCRWSTTTPTRSASRTSPPTGCRSRTRPAPTRCSRRSRTAASRSS